MNKDIKINEIEFIGNDYHTNTFQSILQNTVSQKIEFSKLTLWYETHPFYRLNFYNKVQVSQCAGIFLVFSPDYIKQFDTIIEIGTYNGGLTSWFADNKKENTKIVSFDIDGTINTTGRTDIDFRVESCFDNKTFLDIIDMIQSEGKVLVICDGGDKEKEFNVFSEYLKSGDVIMAHDYRENDEEWKTKTNFWQWPYASDTSFENIKDAIEKNNLSPYKYDECKFVFWASYIKN
jgi:hypothetical protein